MERSVGKALASAIKSEPHTGPGKPAGGIFANGHRRGIFSALTLRPCVGAGQLARNIGIGESGVRWHLRVLRRSGYVAEHRSGRSLLFYPQGLLARDALEIFRILNDPRYRALYVNLLEKPGECGRELASAAGLGPPAVSRMLTAMVKNGLVSRMREGSATRYYPTDLMTREAREFYEHSRAFAAHIIRRLETDLAGRVEVVKRGLDALIIEAGPPGSRYSMSIGLNPYLTSMSSGY